MPCNLEPVDIESRAFLQQRRLAFQRRQVGHCLCIDLIGIRTGARGEINLRTRDVQEAQRLD